MAIPFCDGKDNLWREYLNPLRGLSMEGIVQLVEQGERGAFADVQWFYQAMERSDAMIATIVQRRRSALLGCEWDVVPVSSPSDPALAREQVAFLNECYDAIGNLREAVAFLSTATFRGYAHVEKHFDGQGNVVLLQPVEQWFWCRNGMFGEWKYNQRSQSGAQDGAPVDLGNFVLVEAPMALDRILSVQYFRRNLCMTDWDGYNSVYGIPSFFVIGPPGLNDPVKELEYVKIANAITKDGRGYFPNGTSITYATGGGSGRPPFRDLLDYIDRQIVLVGTGGLLTMLAESGSGTLAGGAHTDSWKQICAADAVMVSEAFRRDFDKALLDQAFPGWPVDAGFHLSPADDTPQPASPPGFPGQAAPSYPGAPVTGAPAFVSAPDPSAPPISLPVGGA